MSRLEHEYFAQYMLETCLSELNISILFVLHAYVLSACMSVYCVHSWYSQRPEVANSHEPTLWVL